MGYACPVCDTPQADGEHLANHLAITALLHGGDHEAWLDERIDDWAECDPDGLAEEVVEYADEVHHGTVFDDTTGGSAVRSTPERGATREPERLDRETRRIVEEARELTRERRAGGGERENEEE